MLRWKEKSLSLSRIEFRLPIPFHNSATVLTELSQSSVGLFRLEIKEVSWARYFPHLEDTKGFGETLWAYMVERSQMAN